ncbi:MAG: ABC transporter substrate-binding protein, partial [Firmicutes bacterium]|nr:ABC transporter substrate-binding protein [Bacillota bacterium]
MNIRVWPWILLGLALVPALLINIPKPQVIEPSPAQATLVEAIWSMPTNLDPALANTPSEWQVDDNVFEPLLSETSTGQLVPDVASLATFHGNVVTIELGKRHLTNGGVLTATTVAEALARPLLPQVDSPTAKSLLKSVVGYHHMVSGHLNYLSGIKVVNPNTVTITLKHFATVAFLRALANPALSVVPLSDQLRGGADWQFTNLYGTAGYRLTDWVPDDHLTFQRVFGTGPSQVQLQLYSSFQLAVLGFINKTVSVVPVAANQLAKVPVKARNRIAFLPTPGTINLFL